MHTGVSVGVIISNESLPSKYIVKTMYIRRKTRHPTYNFLFTTKEPVMLSRCNSIKGANPVHKHNSSATKD